MEKMVVENLFNGNRDEQIQATIEMGKFSNKQRQKLAEKGIISPLISMLQSRDFEAIEAALFSLLSLAFGSDRNKIRIVKSGAIPVLLELLQCQCQELVGTTVAAFLTLSTCAENKKEIALSGAIQLLIEILNEEHDRITIQTKLDAIATLHNLSTCNQIIPWIVSSHVVFSLLYLIQSAEKSSGLVEKSTILLENIVSSSDTALQETASFNGAIRALVEAVEEGSPECKEHAVGILLLVCKSGREIYRGLILREGVMPGLLQLSVDGTRRAKTVARELLLLLRDCSDYGSRNKQSKYDVVEQIMQEIDAEGEKVEGTTSRMVEEMIAKLST